MVWALENPPNYTQSHRLATVLTSLIGQHFPGVQRNAERFFSLYYYLLANLNTPVSKLQKEVTDEGVPIFSPKDMKEIVAELRKQKQKQYGGSNLDADPSRSGFWDKLIRKITLPVTTHIPPSWDGVLWYFHILYHLEQTEFVGPMISTALDTVTLSMPVLADLAEETASKFVSLAPVPYASFVGDGIGYMISLIFVSFGVMLNFSRKHFGSAFKVSLEAVPVVGDSLMTAAQSMETGAERYLNNRKKLLKSVDEVSPAAEDVLNYYTPDVELHTEAPPSVSLRNVKLNVLNYVAEKAGIRNAAALVADPYAAAASAAAKAQNAAANAATGAVTRAQNAATSAVTRAQNAAEKALVVKGGRRKTRKNVLLSSRKYR